FDNGNSNQMTSRKSKLCVFVAVATWLAAMVGAQGQLPTIDKDPQGTSILVGSIATLTVVGSGATSYKWLLNSVPIAGATNAAYRTSYIQKSDEGNYQAVLINGSGSRTSLVARVNVVTNDIPGINTNLVAHFPFEQNLTDVSAQANNGTWVGNANWTETGKCGGGGLQVFTKSDGTEI